MTTPTAEQISAFRIAVCRAAKDITDTIAPDFREAEELEAQADALAEKGHDKAADAVRKSAQGVRTLAEMAAQRQREDVLRALLPECKESLALAGLPVRRLKKSLGQACSDGVARADAEARI